MLNLIFVEAALETIPPSIKHHPSVRKNAKKRGKKPDEVLLDRSLHHAAMKGLLKSYKRGRPDIVHLCLLGSLETPLNRKGFIRTWVHTIGGYTIEVAPEAKIPKNHTRFKGLIEQMFLEGQVPPNCEKPLLSLSRTSLPGLIEKTGASSIIALTSHGRPTSLGQICRRLVEEETAVLIGAYPHGPLEEETLSIADEALSIYTEVLEAWVVTSRLIYEFERVKNISS